MSILVAQLQQTEDGYGFVKLMALNPFLEEKHTWKLIVMNGPFIRLPLVDSTDLFQCNHKNFPREEVSEAIFG